MEGGWVSSASWAAEGRPAGKGVWPGGLSAGTEKGPLESRPEKLSSQGLGHLTFPCLNVFPCVTQCSWSFVVFMLAPRPQTVPKTAHCPPLAHLKHHLPFQPDIFPVGMVCLSLFIFHLRCLARPHGEHPGQEKLVGWCDRVLTVNLQEITTGWGSAWCLPPTPIPFKEP